MRLVQSRREYWEQYQNCIEPVVLTEYRKHRDSEHWRTSRSVEQLCEIILKLEEQKESRMTEKRTLEQVKEYAEALQNEAKREGRPSHPHGETLEDIADGWQAERDLLVGILENILETCDSEQPLEEIRMDAEYGLRMIKGEQG